MEDFQKFQSHVSMTLGEYSEFRCHALPDGADPEREGYLTLNNVGTEEEYISWTPEEEMQSQYEAVTIN